ncbi:MAG: DNA-binding protein [Firmicutes bacterium]|nr:DNA-binding protein [Bacillota bacterium]
MKSIGIDTSNYTTSVCAYNGAEISDKRRIIPVKRGERGIRQSEGVFEHVRALPRLYAELDAAGVGAVGVSARPRNADGSYMPVFLAGKGYAEVIAKTAGVPLYEFSHQDGHIAAGILSGKCDCLLEGDFAALHISGGTTEFLKCRYNGYNFDVEIIGGTKDISAGQLIDRVGVYMGTEFPAGRAVEALAEQSEKKLKLPVSVNGGYINFSGLENKARFLLETESKAVVSRAVLDAVGESLIKAAKSIFNKIESKRLLAVGGVASNKIIRGALSANLNADVYFASPEMSSDNAAGIAYLAYMQK